MTTENLRAESQSVQDESGGELTTRAAMLMFAADEIDRRLGGGRMGGRDARMREGSRRRGRLFECRDGVLRL
jgi:hypothetical protein